MRRLKWTPAVNVSPSQDKQLHRGEPQIDRENNILNTLKMCLDRTKTRNLV